MTNRSEKTNNKRKYNEGPGDSTAKNPDQGSKSPLDNVQLIKARTHFSDIMDKAVYEWIDPLSCIPFTKTRAIVQSGVYRLMSIFDGKSMGESITGGGISCGSCTAIVVNLDGTLQNYVYEHFKEQGLSESEVKQRVEAREKWFGIIDGEHSHAALLKLMERSDRWVGYKWHVTVVQGRKCLERYKQMARMQNDRHDSRHFIEITFFDMISNMRSEYERLRKVQKRVTGQDVINAYLGYAMTSKKVSTLLQTANTVMRLPESVIQAIGEISNSEHAEFALGNPKLNDVGATTVDDLMEKKDCRIFRKFIHITSLKSARTYMTAKHKYGEAAQVNTIYRAKDLYQRRNFSKSIQPEEISKQYDLSISAIQEEKKFLNYISPDKWPVEMDVLRHNLLRSVQLDEEIERNHGNKDVLPSILKAYKRHFPAEFIAKDTAFKLENEKDDSHVSQGSQKGVQKSKAAGKQVNEDQEPPSSPPSADPTNQTDSNIPVNPISGSDDEKKKERKIVKKETGGMDSLTDNGINCFNMEWQEFMSEVWKDGDQRFDAIITNPPDAPSRSFIKKDLRNHDLSS